MSKTFERWRKEYAWHLYRRGLLTLADINEDGIETDFKNGVEPDEAVANYLEEENLDDVVARPEAGPSQEFWRKWERQNPFPRLCTTES